MGSCEHLVPRFQVEAEKRNLKRLGIRPDIIHRLSIASYEAEMNAVIYADSAAMEFRITPEEVSLRVRDRGT